MSDAASFIELTAEQQQAFQQFMISQKNKNSEEPAHKVCRIEALSEPTLADNNEVNDTDCDEDIPPSGSVNVKTRLTELVKDLDDNKTLGSWSSVCLDISRCVKTKVGRKGNPFNIYFNPTGKKSGGKKVFPKAITCQDVEHVSKKKHPLLKQIVSRYSVDQAFTAKFKNKKWIMSVQNGVRKMLNVGQQNSASSAQKNLENVHTWTFYHEKNGKAHFHIIVCAPQGYLQASQAYKESTGDKIAPMERSCHTVKNVGFTLLYNFLDPEKMFMGTNSKFGRTVARTVLKHYDEMQIHLGELEKGSKEGEVKMKVEIPQSIWDDDSSSSEESEMDTDGDSDSDSDSECKNSKNIFNTLMEITPNKSGEKKPSGLTEKKINQLEYHYKLAKILKGKGIETLGDLFASLAKNFDYELAEVGSQSDYILKRVLNIVSGMKNCELGDWELAPRNSDVAQAIWNVCDVKWRRVITATVCVVNNWTVAKKGGIRIYGNSDVGKSHCITDPIRILSKCQYNPTVSGSFPFGELAKQSDVCIFDDKSFTLDRVENVEIFKNVLGRAPQYLNVKYAPNSESKLMPVIYVSNSKEWGFLGVPDQFKHAVALKNRLFLFNKLSAKIPYHIADARTMSYVYLGVFDMLKSKNYHKYPLEQWTDEIIPNSLL